MDSHMLESDAENSDGSWVKMWSPLMKSSYVGRMYFLVIFSIFISEYTYDVMLLTLAKKTSLLQFVHDASTIISTKRNIYSILKRNIRKYTESFKDMCFMFHEHNDVCTILQLHYIMLPVYKVLKCMIN